MLLEKEKLEKKGNNWESKGIISKEVTEEFYDKYINASEFFKNIGGTERLKINNGVTILTSISPDKKNKTIAIFTK